MNMRGLANTGMSGEPSTSSCQTQTASQRVIPVPCKWKVRGRRQRCFSASSQQSKAKRRCGLLAPCKAEGDNGSEERSNSTATKDQEARIKQTLAGLDALLGIDPDEELKKKAAEEARKQKSKEEDNVDVTFSKEVIDAIAKAESGRLSKDRKDIDKDEMDKYLAERMTNIIKNARQLSDETSNREGRRGIERDLDTLLQTFMMDGRMQKDHRQRLKDKVFDGSGFYVTELSPSSRLFPRANPNNFNTFVREIIPGSTLVRGNLRGNREEVFDIVCKRLESEFGNTYTATLMLDPMAEQEDQNNPRVAFQIASSSFVQPPETRQWQWVLATILGLLTLGTAFQLGLTANISTLPKEIVDFIAQPDSLKGDVPEFVENYDALPFLLSALPISLSVLGSQLAHELGHKVVADSRKVKLGAPVFLPNAQLGLFGAITQLKSMVRSRTDLFDIAAAGPAAGAFVSTSLFLVGLYLSGHSSADALLPVPGALLEGSLLLGSLTHIVLGDTATSSTISLHPVMIAGWCGLVTTALNCLPVGSLDGGRVMLAAFGRNLLSVTSFFTYVGLGLGFLGSGLALPFGLFILLVQRDPEKYVQDTVSPTDNNRQTAAAILITTAILVLLPMLPGSSLGSGGINL